MNSQTYKSTNSRTNKLTELQIFYKTHSVCHSILAKIMAF